MLRLGSISCAYVFLLGVLSDPQAWCSSFVLNNGLAARAPTILRAKEGSLSSAANQRILSTFAASIVALGTLGIGPGIVIADEYGVEKEAPTVFTGETVQICTKRGPLGACLETTTRTEENDNDLARKYFRDPAALLKEKKSATIESSDEGNELIQRLRQRSEENKEKNDLYVQRKTFENDQAASFGPFDRQVLIMNTDERTFTLLENPQAMRLKDAGFIVDRKFVKQPTAEQLEQALVPDGSGLAGVIQSMFGGGSES